MLLLVLCWLLAAKPLLAVVCYVCDVLTWLPARPLHHPPALLLQVVRSIHVTGHSLGGALASLCAYDLSTAVAEAVAAEQDPIASDEFKAVEVGS